MAGFGPVGSHPIGALPASGGGGGIVVSGSISSALFLSETYTSAAFAASGGTGPYTFSATGLPTGLSINALTGVVSGQTTAAGVFSATITATDLLLATGNSSPQATVVVPTSSFNYDFPNPRARPRSVDLRIWVQQTPVALYQAAFGPALQVSKLLGYAVEGPDQISASASKLLGYAVEGPDQISASASKLLGYAILQPAPLGRFQAYWPNPQARRRDPLLEIWNGAVNLNLVGQDQVYGAPGQVPTYDLRPRVGRRVGGSGWASPMNLCLLGSAAGADDGFTYIIF